MKAALITINLLIFSVLINAQSITWTGETNTNWGIATNWSNNVVPSENDSVIIPPAANNPVLDADRSVGNILIQFDAVLDFGTKKLNVNEDFTNDGTIITDKSTIVFSGTTPQRIDGNHTFNNLVINNAKGVTNNWGETKITGKVNLIAGNLTTNNAVVLIYDDSEKRYRETFSTSNNTRVLAIRE